MPFVILNAMSTYARRHLEIGFDRAVATDRNRTFFNRHFYGTETLSAWGGQ